MNVYDFDGTIYDGDSTIDFYLYCISKNPKVLKSMIKQIKGFLLYFFKRIDKTEMKQYFYSFLEQLDNVDVLLESFWDKNISKIKPWYMNQKKVDDVIISASPKFLLEVVCKKLEIKNLIASKVDKENGKCLEKNCRGEEKVKLFKKMFENAEIDKFYSDSKSDLPLAKYSKEPYLVNKNKITKWVI